MTIRFRTKPTWPRFVQGTGGVIVERANGRATISFDYTDSELGAALGLAVSAAEGAADAAAASVVTAQGIVDAAADAVPQFDSYQAWYNVKKKIADNNADINILVGMDSTGDSPNDLPDKIAQIVFQDATTHSVDIYYYNFTTQAWGSPTRRQTGSGSYVIKIWNASIDGGTLDALTGHSQTGIGASYDMLLLSYGHNYNTWDSLGIFGFSGTDTAYRQDESFEDLIRIHSDVPILISLQNPSFALWDTNRDERAHRAFGQIVEWRDGISFVDGRRIIIDAGKLVADYADDIHLTPAGYTKIANEHLRCFRASRGRFVNPPRPRQVCQRPGYFANKNLLLNGFFGNFTLTVPDDWTKTGAGTTAQETVTVASYFNSVGVKLTDNVKLSQTLSDDVLDTIRGKSLVFACLLNVKGGDQNKDAGNMKIFGGVGGEAYNGNIATPGSKACWLRHGYPYANEQYAWKFCEEKIPYDAGSGSVIVEIYGTPGSTGDGKSARFSVAGLFLREDFDRFQPWF